MEYVQNMMDVSSSELADLIDYSKDLALSSGLIVKYENKSDDKKRLVTHAPLTLLPSPIPRKCFNKAKSIQLIFNRLFHKVAHDHEFLEKCFKNTIEVDSFSRELWNIYEIVKKEGFSQNISFNINRSDYMFHKDVKGLNDQVCIKQVEFNTTASSFGGLSSLVTLHHQAILDICKVDYLRGTLPVNDTMSGIVEGFITAWEIYKNEKAAISFLVLPNEWNTYDQRIIEYEIKRRNSQIKVLRVTLEEMNNHAKIDGDKKLYFCETEIAVVYFRCTYHPSHMKNEKDWKTRLMIERSCAIKSPSIHYLLAGMKKVQQMLTCDGVLEKYIKDSEELKELRDTFVGIYSLDLTEKDTSAITDALSHPECYVIKPQREGGGNNIYGDEVKEFLESNMDSEERNAYILMDRINAVPFKNIGLECELSSPYQTYTSELGIFGVTIGSSCEIFMNKQSGHLLRTKLISSDEGGVAVGHSALDSPYLID